MTEASADSPQETASPESYAAQGNKRWYVVHAYSGMEKAVERNILERINRAGMQSKFGRILVPTEEVVEIKNGQKRTSERRFYPGYVLVQMTAYVFGFVVIMAIFLWLTDKTLEWVFYDLILGWKK